MMSSRRSSSLNFTMPLVLEPPRHGGLTSIALVPGRHLIGAAADCTIRLQAEGILDRHAMILVGENRTVVKSLDPRTWVNDGPVSEMALRAGDRLSIGPLTFRVRAATKDELVAFEIRDHQEISGSQAEQDLTLAKPQQEVVIPELPKAANDVPAATVPTILNVRSQVSQKTQHGSELAPLSSDAIATVGDSPVVRAEANTNPLVATSSGLTAREGSTSSRHGGTLAQGIGFDIGGEETQGAEDSTELDRRLDEIQQRLADLGPTEFSYVPLNEPLVSQRERRSAVRRNADTPSALSVRAEQLARESTEVQQRLEKVINREQQLERRQRDLMQEAERIAQVAEQTRQALADEHAEHFSIWQEWEGTFQRITTDLAEKLSAFERQRDVFRLESQRLQELQDELQNARFAQERERQAHLAERIKLQNEFADLNSQRAQQERVQLQHQREIEEQRVGLEADRNRLQDERAEIATLKIELLRQRQLFDLDRSQFDVTRTGLEDSLRELQGRCQRAEADLITWQKKSDADSAAMATCRASDTARIEELQTQLASVQLELHSQQEMVAQLRCELEAVRLSCPRAIESLPEAGSRSDEITAHVNPEELDRGLKCLEPGQIPDVIEDTVTPVAVIDRAIAQDVDAIWGTSPLVEQDRIASADLTRLPKSTDPFGGSVDWNTLASIEQQFGSPPPCDLATNDAKVDQSEVPIALGEPLIPRPLSAESGHSTGPFATHSVWPEISAWPMPISQLPGAGVTDETTASYTLVGPTTAAISKIADDPWADFGRSQEDISSTRQAPQLDEILESGAMIIGESEPRGPYSDFSGLNFTNSQDVASTPDAHRDAQRTLADINREFGTAVQDPPADEAKSSLPAWWLDATNAENSDTNSLHDSGKPGWVVEALRAKPVDQTAEQPHEEPQGKPVDFEAPSDDLRSKLAMLFEIPLQTPQETADQSTLRELVGAASEPPALQADVQAASVTECVESESIPHGEDSVEAFMARLLARSRAGGGDAGKAEGPVPELKPSVSSTSKDANLNLPREESKAAQLEPDRSHLMEGPKHKQDKQAVRENLQSFRQVAHLSARSALAKHSLQQLRNATIAKGVLLAASGIATIWFFAEPLIGRPLQLWKGSACALGLILSAIEFSRSWRQLMKPIRAASTSNCDLEAATPEAPTDSTEIPPARTDSASVRIESKPTAGSDGMMEAPGE